MMSMHLVDRRRRSTSDPVALPFRLLDLPSEIVLLIVKAVDHRPLLNLTFPANPCSELLKLRATSSTFYRLLHPIVWRSRLLHPADIDDMPSSDEDGPYSAKQRRNMKSLKRLKALIERNDALIAKTETSSLLPIRLEMVYFSNVGQSGLKGEDMQELSALVGLIEIFAPHLTVAFFHELALATAAGDRLIHLLHSAPQLKTLRLNQCDIGKLRGIEAMGPFPSLRALHVMHGGKRNLQLLRLCPALETIILWPSSRSLGPLVDMIVSALPMLRCLSLDVVKEPEVINSIADSLLMHGKANAHLPLCEFFIEATLPRATFLTLLQGLAYLRLKKLALYWLFKATPLLIEEIATELPALEALTLVQGETDYPVEWPYPLEEYTKQLSKLKHLRFFAYDRKSDYSQGALPANSRHTAGHRNDALLRSTEKDLRAIKAACENLREAVAIRHDVSEGCEGVFASFDGTGQAGSIKETSVVDFLINFETWAVV